MTTKHAQISNWRNELTPNIVDHLARLTPDAPYALYPNHPLSYSHGYRTVTYKDLANAIDGLAWWLNENLGKPSQNFDVLSYVGPNDVRYTALVLAAIKAGYVTFLTSPRNSPAAHSSLFKQLNCNTLLTSSPTPPPAESILKSYPLKHLQIPSVTDLLGKENPHYPYEKTFAAASSEPFVILHTSGSTGMPKPLIWTHDTIAVGANFAALDPPSEFQALDTKIHGKRALNAFPPFHAACVAIHMANCIPFGTVSISPLSGPPPTAEGLLEALNNAPAQVAYLAPSIVADLAKNPEVLDACSKQIDLILYAGGDLPEALGNAVAAKIPMRCQYGATELGFLNQVISPEVSPEDWRYMRFHPDLGLEFEETNPGLYELTVKRDPRYERNQLPFTIQPLQQLKVYRSKDLFEKHPTLPEYWAWHARSDDIIVFLNGLKVNPISTEQLVFTSNKDVSAVLVVGTQRFQAALLVESSIEDKPALLDKIWPSVEKANENAPAYAQIEKHMILITSPGKPMVRSGKGTIQRAGTLTQYSAEIDQLYQNADAVLTGVERASLDSKNPDAVSMFIQRAISDINPDLVPGETENFFASGMDSLVSVRLVRALRHGLGQPDFNVSDIHGNPSIKQLTQRIVDGRVNDNGENAQRQIDDIESLLEPLRKEIRSIQLGPPSQQAETKSREPGEVVLLTGSTGSLGTQLLEAMLAKPNISHVYCLNRRDNAEKTQESNSKANGFPLDQYKGRISFLKVSLDKPSLGLDEQTYSLLLSTVTLIIHNAWSVNFIMPLKSFTPQFNGMINLFRFMASRHEDPPKFLYISSISSVSEFLRHGSNQHTIPEEVIRNLQAPLNIGYAKSKLVSENLCHTAAQCLHIPISFARVGQIAGRVGDDQTLSVWNPVEWLPSIIITSIALGALPEDLGAELNKVAWMPSDMLSNALVELGTSNTEKMGGNTGAQVFNLVNPSTTTWQHVVPIFASSIQKHTNTQIDVVDSAKWLEKLKKVTEDYQGDMTELARTHPAIKLQGFFETHMFRTGKPLEWDVERAVSASITLKEMPAVNEEWIDRWVRGWLGTLA
ncbi:acetyl-CoA synthetase-like protein [Periconia macrospinosa]|uniref:Acetyl-CoA synthetase-like protein n=1 Tax=Periconia macrospinosa TaxID=97972 RepID=A0A2V1DJ68_9PLEO|nr:acetyl-CoA synthetase-like protein [Periconia macrospinosa]